MYNIAAHMLAHVEPAGCAIHLALDLQGWQPPRDFMDRFVTRSKRVTKLNGVSDFEITTGEIAAQYAYGQSYLFGTAGALQCALYNKTRQAHSRDKLHFWEGIWKQATGDDPLDEPYDPDQDVWRIEMRFHQSVLREYAQGTPPWRTEPLPRTSASASTTSSARGPTALVSARRRDPDRHHCELAECSSIWSPHLPDHTACVFPRSVPMRSAASSGSTR